MLAKQRDVRVPRVNSAVLTLLISPCVTGGAAAVLAGRGLGTCVGALAARMGREAGCLSEA